METERITLRPWRDSDAGALYKYASDPDVGPRAGWPPHRSVEESLEIIRTLFHNDTTWAIVLKETGEAVGAMGYGASCACGLPAREGEPTVGYWVGKPYWNRGICTEALQLLIEHVREHTDIPSLISGHFTDNPGSGRVMEKCGFVATGETCFDEGLYGGANRPVRVLRLELNRPPRFCQSCGMPLTEALLGTEADGSRNRDYCIYCYKDGAFTGNFTMEEMVEFCAQFVEQYNRDSGRNLTQEEYKSELRAYYPMLKRWRQPADTLPRADSPVKRQFIDEINALGIAGLPKIGNLFVLQGSSINLEYRLNGNAVKLLDDDKSYWGTQVGKNDASGRSFGIACDERYILVSEYGKEGADAEIVLLRKRHPAAQD